MTDLLDFIDIELPNIDALPEQVSQSYWLATRMSYVVLDWLTRSCCWYCGTQLDDSNYTIDHVQPTSRGGNNELVNLVPACNTCNSTKGAKNPAQFRQYLTRIFKLPAGFSVAFWGELRGLGLPLIYHFKPEDWICPLPKPESNNS